MVAWRAGRRGGIPDDKQQGLRIDRIEPGRALRCRCSLGDLEPAHEAIDPGPQGVDLFFRRRCHPWTIRKSHCWGIDIQISNNKR